MNIVLLGFMGTGKSVVGKRLAEFLERQYIDVDTFIEKNAGISISEIFSTFGEPYFRELEKAAVRKLSKEDNRVISTGGGVVLLDENMENLRANGVLITLKASPKIILKRVKSKTHRPLLSVSYPEDTIKELLEYRKPFYEKADIVLDTSNLSVAEVCDTILEYLKRKGIKL